MIVAPPPVALDVPYVDHLRVDTGPEVFAGTTGVESLTAGAVGEKSSDAAPEASAPLFAAAGPGDAEAPETVALFVGGAVRGACPLAAARALAAADAAKAARDAFAPPAAGELVLALRSRGADFILDDDAALGDALRAGDALSLVPKPAAAVPPPPSAGRVLRATGAAGADDVFDASTESEGSSAGDEGSDAEDPVVFAGQVFSRKFRDDAGGSDVYEGVVVDRATSEAGKRGWKVSYAADGYEEVLSTRRLAALVARPPVAASRPRRPPSDGARGVILSFGEGGWFSVRHDGAAANATKAYRRHQLEATAPGGLLEPGARVRVVSRSASVKGHFSAKKRAAPRRDAVGVVVAVDDDGHFLVANGAGGLLGDGEGYYHEDSLEFADGFDDGDELYVGATVRVLGPAVALVDEYAPRPKKKVRAAPKYRPPPGEYLGHYAAPAPGGARPPPRAPAPRRPKLVVPCQLCHDSQIPANVTFAHCDHAVHETCLATVGAITWDDRGRSVAAKCPVCHAAEFAVDVDQPMHYALRPQAAAAPVGLGKTKHRRNHHAQSKVPQDANGFYPCLRKCGRVFGHAPAAIAHTKTCKYEGAPLVAADCPPRRQSQRARAPSPPHPPPPPAAAATPPYNPRVRVPRPPSMRVSPRADPPPLGPAAAEVPAPAAALAPLGPAPSTPAPADDSDSDDDMLIIAASA